MPKIIKRAIIEHGKIIGYRLYTTGGLFGELVFCGYEWKD